ncbi:bifunctional 2-polyprenyl-6-hydroxyphenol methylase/3-demethylubiquinol 3-O-methyltransferase UbiG [Devosia sp.]|uniref:class I SAM-dependent methyltransferase n=1 Tax=Devosia sp. TaxID=1871048 RepID=UPI001AC2B01D|nr:class I SAM-dependent methyltransferase [Devosia sp.]MBN9335706.1 class I SAM-dependent methyltransferase [Devosia sp.]
MADDTTLRFYAKNAETYAQHATTPNGAQLDGFLALVPAAGKILELGCGNGRDAARMLEPGFDVDATDGTAELAAEAERRIGRKVRVLRFEHLDAIALYDGIWASASLLHVPAETLVDILTRIRKALRPGGIFTASFKAGTGEGRDDLGRYYNYPSAERLLQDYRAAGWNKVTIEKIMGSGYDAKPTEWLWVTARHAA